MARGAGTLLAPAVRGGIGINMMDQRQSAEANTNGRRKLYLNGDDTALSPQAVQEIVQRHCVCYEVWPEWSANGGRATRIGFSISLCGIHENGAGQHDVPGCPHCWSTYNSLRKAAEWILPEEERLCRFEVGAYDRSWHVAPSARGGRNETIVTIKIFHRRNVHAPIDDCQQQCLNEMRATMASLGIRENMWAPSAK